MPSAPELLPRLWHLPRTGRHSLSVNSRALVGRQGIFTAARDLAGYELLFRAPGRMGLRVDLWNARQQDRATAHVIAAAFHRGPRITEGLPAFINFTRSYLVERAHLHCDPAQVVIEVVESAYADAALHARLGQLREQGFRIAIDDFTGTRSQVALLEHADFVKIDYRDLTARGPRLIDLARREHCTLVAERLETAESFDECKRLSFELFQGYFFEPTIIVDRGVVNDLDDDLGGELVPA